MADDRIDPIDPVDPDDPEIPGFKAPLKVLSISKQLYTITDHDNSDVNCHDLILELQSEFYEASRHIMSSHTSQFRNLTANIYNRQEIIHTLKTYRHRCFKANDLYALRNILRWFFFSGITVSTSIGSSMKFVARKDELDIKYYELISILIEIYNEISMDLMSRGHEIFDKGLELTMENLINDWLEKNMLKIKSANKI